MLDTNPVCITCGTKMCSCLGSVPVEKRKCLKCKNKERKEAFERIKKAAEEGKNEKA